MTCQSSMAATLTALVSDDNGGVNTTVMSYKFLEVDGVEAGADYTCDVSLSADTVTSGHSPPAYVTTITVAGQSTVHSPHLSDNSLLIMDHCPHFH